MHLLSILITSLGIVIEMLSSLFESKKKIKITFIIIGAIVAITGILIGAIDKKREDQEHAAEVKKQDSTIAILNQNLFGAKETINKISTNLDLQKQENDSLKGGIGTLNQQNDKILAKAFSLEKKEDDHFIDMQQSIGDVTERFGYRKFNQSTEKSITNELKSLKKCKVSLMLAGSSQEIVSFADQFNRIFIPLGWDTKTGTTIPSSNGIPTKDVVMVFDTTDLNIRKVYNILYGYMNLSGYKMYFLPVKSKGISEFKLEFYPFSGKKE